MNHAPLIPSICCSETVLIIPRTSIAVNKKYRERAKKGRRRAAPLSHLFFPASSRSRPLRSLGALKHIIRTFIFFTSRSGESAPRPPPPARTPAAPPRPSPARTGTAAPIPPPAALRPPAPAAGGFVDRAAGADTGIVCPAWVSPRFMIILCGGVNKEYGSTREEFPRFVR